MRLYFGELKFCYSFDRRMSLYEDVNYILDIYKASMITFRDIAANIEPVLYADTETLEYLKGYYKEGIDISDKTFEEVDDLKVWIHSVNDLNCVTVDGDILFFSQLVFPNMYNTKVYFEIEETEARSLHSKYDDKNGYETLRNVFKKYETTKYVDGYDYYNTSAYNVGILKFNCQETKDLLIKKYYEIKKFYQDNIKGDNEILDWHVPSIMLTQYFWGGLCRNNKINVTFLNNFNSYKHLYGKWKFADTIPEKIYGIISKDIERKLI